MYYLFKTTAHTQLRSDHVDLLAYYQYTGLCLEPISMKLNGFQLCQEHN